VWSFVLSAPDNGGYISVGFSPTGRMVGSSAVAGWVTAAGAGSARQYYLGGTSSGSCPPDQGKLALARGAAAPTIVSKGSRLYLAFQLVGQPLTDVVYAVGPSGSLPGVQRAAPAAPGHGVRHHQPLRRFQRRGEPCYRRRYAK